jgi:hypothetical protein
VLECPCTPFYKGTKCLQVMYNTEPSAGAFDQRCSCLMLGQKRSMDMLFISRHLPYMPFFTPLAPPSGT